MSCTDMVCSNNPLCSIGFDVDTINIAAQGFFSSPPLLSKMALVSYCGEKLPLSPIAMLPHGRFADATISLLDGGCLALQDPKYI